ncbi:F-box protein CPR30-like protein [Corchorus capsularis]|uniref:F-box protein CPR30-like protein n=1 Tax=Corchorus capsularis TaxID=210143 RepID=A0A1R3KGM0_COCAP|nr:F-box protein CPR30-like protein [Corchorus capsularis]
MSLLSIEKKQEKLHVKLEENIHILHPLHGLSLRITDPCNGLLCLQEYYNSSHPNAPVPPPGYPLTTIKLWNPCIRQIKILPQFTISPPLDYADIIEDFYNYDQYDNEIDIDYDEIGFSYDIDFHSIGFGFDRKSNDYKVIAFVTYRFKDGPMSSNPQAHLLSK